jgi:hypothetical protein
MNEPKPKRRRWFQFSLRSLMLATVVCAVVFGWLGKRVDETRREEVAVWNILKAAGDVEFHDIDGPSWLTRHFLRVSKVDFGRTQVTDADLEYLKELNRLRELRLDFNDVTGTGLRHLKDQTALGSLHLDYTEIVDVELVHLEELTQLKELSLDGELKGN